MISSKFKFLDNNLTKIVTALQSNQKLMKYLVYLTDDPLAQQTVDRAGKSVLQPDIHYSLIDNYIILDDYDESVLEKTKVLLFIHPFSGTFSETSVTSKDMWAINIIYPYEYGIFKGHGETRYTKIAHEICQSIDLQIIGSGLTRAVDYKKGKLDNGYGYMTIFFKIDNASVGVI